MNRIFDIKEEELPLDTMLNTFTGKVQNITQLAIRFAEEILQSIFSRVDEIPDHLKRFLRTIIENTKEGDLNTLSLADAFVISGFYVQKWVSFGFLWCLSRLRQQMRHTLKAAQG